MNVRVCARRTPIRSIMRYLNTKIEKKNLLLIFGRGKRRDIWEKFSLLFLASKVGTLVRCPSLYRKYEATKNMKF